MIDPVELAGFVLSLAMVYCNIKQIHWAWPLAILSSMVYCFVFWNSQLYGEASLQVMFVLTSAWGWQQWLRRSEHSKADKAPVRISVSSVSPTEFKKALMATLLAWPAFAFFLHRFTDSDVAVWDGLVTALSLLAQYLLAKKKLENWWVWLAVNLITVGLMVMKSLWLTSLLYVLFAILSYVGLKAWQAQHAR